MAETINISTLAPRRFSLGIAGLLWLGLCVPVALASDPIAKTADPPANAALVKREIERHETKAKEYDLQAFTHQAELDALWAKYARERRKIAVLPKMVGENPYVRKLRLETEREAAALTRLAREAEESAQYHRMRAREWAAEQERIASAQ